MRERGKTTRKNVMLVLVALLLVGSLIGGTLAWLTASETVTNTFEVKVGKVNHPNKPADGTPGAADTDESVGKYIYEPKFTDNTEMALGKTITKDPYIGIGPKSEPSYVFAWWEDNTKYKDLAGIVQEGAFDIVPNTDGDENGNWLKVDDTEASNGKSALYVWSNDNGEPLALKPTDNKSAWTACLFKDGKITVKGAEASSLVDEDEDEDEANTVNVYCFIHQAYGGTGEPLDGTALEAAKAAYATNNSPSN